MLGAKYIDANENYARCYGGGYSTRMPIGADLSFLVRRRPCRRHRVIGVMLWRRRIYAPRIKRHLGRRQPMP